VRMPENSSMKNIHLTIIGWLILLAGPAFGQSTTQIQELALLSKTWGLLKYYHPNVATGKYDWDSVLVAATRRLLQRSKGTHIRSEINLMLSLAGKDEAPERLPKPRHVLESRNYDLSWIKTSKLLTGAQQATLGIIATHPCTGANYYARPDPNDDNAVYTPHERPYEEMKMPDVHYRLLSLFRFWNLINYYYPYKYLIGKPWEQVQLEFIPEMLQAGDTVTYHKVLARMAASINDSHGGLWPWVYNSIVGKYGPDFYFRIIEDKIVVTQLKDSVRYRHIRTGTVIDHMDGIPVKEKIRQYGVYIPASNEAARLRDLHHLVLRSKNTTAVLSGRQPDGTPFRERIALTEPNFIRDYMDIFDMRSSITSKMVADRVGYVVFGNISKENIDSIMQPLMSSKAIIFDMRKNMVNGYGIYNVSSYLLTRPVIYSKDTHPDYALPGIFQYDTANKGTLYETVGKNNQRAYGGKVILLVDERTQSVLEWACMIIKTAPHVTVIGSKTAGADGNVTRTTLPGNYKINFSGLGIYYPDGTETQRIGIHVDIPVKVTVDDLVQKRDPALQKAIEFAGMTR
jgi:carboxyl-terminal processing protease